LYTEGMRKNKSGFTLIELLVVIVIMGILVGITLFVYRGAQGRARDAQRQTDIANIQKALELYYDDNGSYPIPSGTSSAVGNTWYSSGDNSWMNFAIAMLNATNKLPNDPTNTSNGSPLTANNYVYGYTTGSYCGKTSGQWYILVYRLEGAKEKKATGDCSTNQIGDGYYNTNGSSYARVTR